ncbi:organic anion transporter 3-like isoform X2 [Argiope bruennichi]|nr:organic anion transporter 3-like isoform X2 [Argiope bruennichi]
MLSSIDERVEDNIERPDSAVQRLNIVDSKKHTLPEFIGGHGPWQYRQWLVYFAASMCSSLYLFSTFPLSAQVYCPCSNFSNISSPEANLFNSVINCAFTKCRRGPVLPGQVTNFSCSNSFRNSDQDEVVCANMKVVIYAKYIYVLGMLLSGLTAHFLSFKFGRRTVAVISGFLLLGFSIATGMSSSLVNYLILRLFISITVTNIYLVSIFSLVECLGEDYKILYAMSGHLGWGVAHFILPLVTWLTKDWLQYSGVISGISIPMIVLSFFIPESIEINIAKGLRAKSQKLIRIAAWKNGYPTEDLEEFTHALCHKKNQEEIKEVWKTANIKRAFELSLLFLVGFSASFLYFTCLGLSDWVNRDRGGFFALAGTTEISATILCLFFVCFVSNKIVWSMATVMASVFLLVLYAKASQIEHFHISTGTFVVTMFFTSASWTIVLMRTLFQPLITANSKWNAFISGFAICCGVLIASLTDLQKFDSWSPKFYVVYAIPNLTLGATVGIIPERYFKF